MTTILWIGLGFLIVLVIFLMVVFLTKDDIKKQHYTILKFLIALSAGFACGFLTGTALVEVFAKLTNGVTMTISGTAGIGLFLVIWFYFPDYELPKPDDSFSFSIGDNWTFKKAIEGIADAVNGLHELKGFTDPELSLMLKSRNLTSKNAKEAMEKLKYLNEKLPEFEVVVTDNIYKILKK